MATCAVCFDTFNKSSRAPTKCPYCETQICRTCLQTYLLNDISDTPQCVNPDCGHGFTREFLDGETTKSFRFHTYKEHREKVLSDREKSRLPATQDDASEYRLASKVFKEGVDKLTVLRQDVSALQREIDIMERKLYRARHVIDTYGRTRLVQLQETGTQETNSVQRQAFIKPCPAEECKGFLSTAWKCGLCDQWTCPECGELKGPNRDIEHTCDPNKVLTAQMLAREAKSCPKCGVQICKIEGCDQMWCTVCNTGFNWRTGKLASGPVHNPHYFEYLRKQGLNPANVQMPVGNCDYEMDRNVTNALGSVPYSRRHLTAQNINKDDQYLLEIWRLMREAQDPYANRNEPDFNETFRQMRVRYMVGELSEDDWKTALQRAEKDSYFQIAKNQVKEVFINASRDLIRQVLEPGCNKVEIRRQVEELVHYCNTSYKAVSTRFNRKTPHIKVSSEKKISQDQLLPQTQEPVHQNEIVH